MDFVPEPSTAAYERYISESDTDGEGDVSGGQRRQNPPDHLRPQHRIQTTPAFPKGIGSVRGGEEEFAAEGEESSDPSGSAGSIFSRLAATWKKTAASTTAATAGDGRSSGGTAGGTGMRGKRRVSHARVEGGTLWKDIQDGSPRGGAGDGGDGRGFGGGNRGGIRDTIAGLSMGSSSSGLKGLKASLLTDKIDPANPTSGGGAREETDGGHGGTPAGGGFRGLWEEAGSGDVKALSAALAPGGGGDIHACMVDGWTALHSAAHAGHAPAVSLLLRNGASTAARAKRGWTPLHAACMRGRFLASRSLLSGGADANARAGDQRTPLHFACEAGSAECVKELLQTGAAANVSDQDARTPLHFACIDGSTECVRRLLAAGASPVPPDAWGRDPAAVARQLGRAGPLRLLEAAAAAPKGRKRGSGSSGRVSSPPVVTLPPGNGGSNASRGDVSDGEEAEAEVGSGIGKEMVGSAGNRWVVMNESGRMLERASGKVALFKSMAAAADWANGLDIRSGSFQVAEVAPAMRKAFEREIVFEITGGGTLSEEEEEEKQDPQWTRFRRQQAAARGERGGARGGGRKRRGAWTSAAQRPDEEEERKLVSAAEDKLREITEERDMHRQKALSLQQALEAVLKDCEAAAAAAAATASTTADASVVSDCGGAVLLDESVAAESTTTTSDKPPAESGSDPKSVPGSQAGSESKAGSADVQGNAAGAPSLLLGVDDPPVVCLPLLTCVDRENADGGIQHPVSGPGHDNESSEVSEISESETDAEVDDDAIDDIIAFDSGHGGDMGRSFDSTGASMGAKNDRQGLPIGDEAPPATDALAGSDGDFAATNDPSGYGFESGSAVFAAETAKRKGSGEGVEQGDLLDVGGGVGGGNLDDDDAAAQERLAVWLSGLKIRRPDAKRYAGSLVADGFDSGEALRGVREEELMQYGMKKGHARLIVRTLGQGIEP